MKGGFFVKLTAGTLFKGPTGDIVIITKLTKTTVFLSTFGKTNGDFNLPRYMFRALYFQK